MKKTILALLLVGTGAAALAQNTRSDSTNAMNNSNNSSITTTDTTINRNSNLNTDVNANTNNNLNSNTNSNQNLDSNNSNSMNSANPMNNMNSSTDSTRTMNNMNNNTMNNANTMNNNSNSTMSSTGSYNAYSAAASVPNKVQSAFQQAYPGATGARWEQSNDFYRVYYQNNGQDMNMYYDARGNSFMMALPVTQSGVTTDVISKIKGMYGTNVYDITPIKVADHSDAYNVRIIENGQIRSEVVDAQGQTVTQIYRTPETDSIWAANERMKRMQAADSARNNWNNTNMSTDQSTTTDSTSTNMNSNSNNSSSNNSTMSTDANTTTNNSGNNNSSTDSSQVNDHNATRTEEPKMKSDSTIKKDE